MGLLNRGQGKSCCSRKDLSSFGHTEEASLKEQTRGAFDNFFGLSLFDDLFSKEGLSVASDEDHVYIEAHVPGVKGEDLDISVDDNKVLRIKAEGEQHTEDKNKHYYRKSKNTFSYAVPLSDDVNIDTASEAICERGVVKISFDKFKKHGSIKKIKIKNQV